MRLDRALAARGLARSRSHALELIRRGAVTIDGAPASKASTDVADDALLRVDDPAAGYVARSALKLLGALERAGARGLTVAGAHCMDAGASTGGFTQVLLEHDAASVLAVDVGHGQLHPSIAADPRVDAREGTNVRDFTRPATATPVRLLVADLSFISLTLVVDALATWLADGGDALLMVKPQFEVGAGALGAGGVVREPTARADAVRRVAQAMLAAGLAPLDVIASPVSGPAGNVEFFIWARKTWEAGHSDSSVRPLDADGLDDAIDREVSGGP